MLSTYLIYVFSAFALAQDWGANVKIPLGSSRANIYQESQIQWVKNVRQGKIHALNYPITSTKLLIPYRSFKKFLAADNDNLLKKIVNKLIGREIDIRSEKDFWRWLGMGAYPLVEELNVFSATHVPLIGSPGYVQGLAMGATLLDANQGKGLTFSCAACHSNDFFGKTIIGMANKRPRSNDLFLNGKKYTPFVSTTAFKLGTGASAEEVSVFESTKKFVKATGGKMPQTLGLDTSLAQLALSLSHRNLDSWFSHSRQYEIRPRKNLLDTHIADSKPLPWWNTKYKTRWLSDGSVISGNPVFTNILWNEIGRGADLKELAAWLDENKTIVKELTTAVFASNAPHWTDFFNPETIDETRARRGEVLYNQACAKCHGGYEKVWSLPYSGVLSKKQRLQTVRVHYFEQTPVKNVGTDPNRYQATRAFANEMNQLTLSQNMQTVIEPQEGYVPPPLVGIWSRYPYLHNNSVPNLCELLKPANARVREFFQGPSEVLERDYDEGCVGYPVGERIPAAWKVAETRFDTQNIGMKNQGHERMLLDESGRERFSIEDKLALIEFLKTL